MICVRGQPITHSCTVKDVEAFQNIQSNLGDVIIAVSPLPQFWSTKYSAAYINEEDAS
jgi:hypothetical protein